MPAKTDTTQANTPLNSIESKSKKYLNKLVASKGDGTFEVKPIKPLRDKNGRLLPGSSLNPSGSSSKAVDYRERSGISIIAEIRKQLLTKPRGGARRTYLQELVRTLLKKAVAGEPTLIREVINRVDGLPTAKIQIDAEVKIDKLAERLKAIALGLQFKEEPTQASTQEPNEP